MPTPDSPPPTPPRPTRNPDPKPRRPTLDEIFGDVLPDTTKDEMDPTPAKTEDDWYEQNRPPHHGG